MRGDAVFDVTLALVGVALLVASALARMWSGASLRWSSSVWRTVGSPAGESSAAAPCCWLTRRPGGAPSGPWMREGAVFGVALAAGGGPASTSDMLAGMLLVGVALLVASALAWSGRWRSWARGALWHSMPIHMFPGLGLLALLGAAIGILDPPRDSAAFHSFFWFWLVIHALGTVLWVFGILVREPRWAQPRWLRDADRTLDIENDEISAVFYLADSVGSVHESREKVEARFKGQEPVVRLSAMYVYDPTASARAHALAGFGTVQGKLSIYPSVLAFHIIAIEERLRNAPFTLVLPSDEMAAVWTVPARCDADGFKHPLPWHVQARLSPYRRLVVSMKDGSVHVFELWGASSNANMLAKRYAVERRPDKVRSHVRGVRPLSAGSQEPGGLPESGPHGASGASESGDSGDIVRFIVERTQLDAAEVVAVLEFLSEHMFLAGIQEELPGGLRFYPPGARLEQGVLDEAVVVRDAERLAGLDPDVVGRVLEVELECLADRGLTGG